MVLTLGEVISSSRFKNRILHCLTRAGDFEQPFCVLVGEKDPQLHVGANCCGAVIYACGLEGLFIEQLSRISVTLTGKEIFVPRQELPYVVPDVALEHVILAQGRPGYIHPSVLREFLERIATKVNRPQKDCVIFFDTGDSYTDHACICLERKDNPHVFQLSGYTGWAGYFCVETVNAYLDSQQLHRKNVKIETFSLS